MSGAYRFIGKEGSMDLQHGTVYILNLYSDVGLNGEIWATMWSKDHTLCFWKCPYDSWNKFKENWESA